MGEQDGGASQELATEAALPWLSLQRGSQLACCEEAQNALRQELGPLNLVMICGRLRTGKSYLLNALTKRQCFGVSGQARSFTRGVEISRRFYTPEELGGPPSNKRDEEEAVKIAFADLEGQGDKGLSQDVKVAVPVLLASKAVIFLEVCPTGPSKESVLESLQVMIQAAEFVANRQQRKHIFGGIHVVLRDCHQSEAECQEILFAQEDEADAETDEHVKAIRTRNEVRRALNLAFERPPKVWCLPKLLSKDAPVDYRDTSDEFRERVDALRNTLIEQLAEPKLLDGQPLTGPTVAALMPLLAETLKSDAPSLNPTSLMQRVVEVEMRRVLDEQLQALNSATETLEEDLPVAQVKLEGRLENLRKNFEKSMKDKLLRLGATEEGCTASLTALHTEFKHLLSTVCMKNEGLLRDAATRIQQEVMIVLAQEYLLLRERLEHFVGTTSSPSSSSSSASPTTSNSTSMSFDSSSSYLDRSAALKRSCREIREAAQQKLQAGLCDLPPEISARMQATVDSTCDTWEDVILKNFEFAWKLKEAEDKGRHYRGYLLRGGLLMAALLVVVVALLLAHRGPEVAQPAAPPLAQDPGYFGGSAETPTDQGLASVFLTEKEEEVTIAGVAPCHLAVEEAQEVASSPPQSSGEVHQEKKPEGAEDASEEQDGTATPAAATRPEAELEEQELQNLHHEFEEQTSPSSNEPWMEALWAEDP
eukprot:CAMPEP_0206463018 /NCGR_PEP_ID=MMETSP0324_2-20121206/26336_1 /ASSEMBLY_ACC=CAM_ASM_000836 /TAXON_ID=2866 /ORGANISM="Crypthecodinium cohnii, Strain Seligo" /LENGTH=706 /DNA_ID=CAMNT_0053935309 /DNA_START=301 /DNA_END=2418 /DNA_ORIENTATION=+